MSKTTIIATGDSFMTRRLPENGYDGFEQIREILSQYDVRFSNLEITTHDQEGVPAAFSGGTWAMAEPEILDDLKNTDLICTIPRTIIPWIIVTAACLRPSVIFGNGI